MLSPFAPPRVASYQYARGASAVSVFAGRPVRFATSAIAASVAPVALAGNAPDVFFVVRPWVARTAPALSRTWTSWPPNTGTPPISCCDRTTLPNGIAREFSACIDGCAMVAYAGEPAVASDTATTAAPTTAVPAMTRLRDTRYTSVEA